MGNCNDCSFVLLQVRLQPLYALCVQVVCRLVQEKHIRLLKKQSAQCNPSALSAGEVFYQCIGRRNHKGIHCALQFALQLPASKLVYLLCKFALTLYKLRHLIIREGLCKFCIYCIVLLHKVCNLFNPLFNYLFYSLLVIKYRLLLQITHSVSRGKDNLTLVRILYTCNYLKKC